MKPHYIKVCKCGKQYSPIGRQKYCSRKCLLHYWIKTPVGRACAKRQYEKSKIRGTAYYMTAAGKENNLKRSKTYRLLHYEELKKYKREKGREYNNKRRERNGGTILSLEETRKLRETSNRLNQRLARQSIRGTRGTMTDYNQVDIKALERDVEQLTERKAKLTRTLRR